MSKNVAVFIDVANVFYAAKAAGVDIDYVTLLRAAVAGRDFVRAYAYTGLDPENDNQRQFQAFLARNGYKVVTKDIRKYGDGKVKANLDIELVVDMMKTARNLDVAVVVSGDGDFAPAIRAVQEMGVRVEVISFRGNTSSDLMDVADSFTDITQVARVERGSSRSGRRVAAEADLSMTEVPEKETEGATRRRRRTREDERRRPAAATPSAPAAGLTVLPGERLSRAATEGGEAEEEPEVAAVVPAAEEASAGAAAAEAAGEQNGRRRRRRRGGRGRGRGRGAEAPGLPQGLPEEPAEEEEELAPEPPRLPVHSTFGSVWDSQLGMPSAPLSTPAPGELDEEMEEEPEIPEYLLAEQRRRGGRGRGRGRGRASAYQQAVDRERFGRSGSSSGPLLGRREQRERVARPPRERSGGRPPARPPRESPSTARAPQSDEPWSEVPPEVEELLRAELARRGGTPSGMSVPSEAPVTREPEAAAEDAAPAPARRAGRPRRGVAPAPDVFAADLAGRPAGEESASAAPTPRRRSRSTPAASTGEAAGSPAIVPEVAAETGVSRPAARARRGRKAAAESPDADAAPVAEPQERSTRRRTRATQPAEASEGAGAAPGDAGTRTPTRRTRSRAAATDAEGSVPGDASAAEPAPAKRRSRRRATEEATE